jgi:hypothetical protein
MCPKKKSSRILISELEAKNKNIKKFLGRDCIEHDDRPR